MATYGEFSDEFSSEFSTGRRKLVNPQSIHIREPRLLIRKRQPKNLVKISQSITYKPTGYYMVPKSEVSFCDITKNRAAFALNGAELKRESNWNGYMEFDGTDASYGLAQSSVLANLSQGAIICRFKYTTGWGGYVLYQQASNYNMLTLTISESSSSAVWNIGNNTARSTVKNSWNLDQWYEVALVFGSDIKLYVDGKLDTTIPVDISTIGIGPCLLNIGRYAYSTGCGSTGGYAKCALSRIELYDKAVSDTYIHNVFKDPYQFLIPA